MKRHDPLDFNENLIIDRYGATAGKFTAPANTPFGQRALPSSYESQIPQKYKVLKAIPNVEEGRIIPWFNQPGLGTQYKLEKSVQYYPRSSSALCRVTLIKKPSGRSTNTQYTVANAPKNLTYSIGFSLNRNDILLNQEWLFGPSATASRSFFSKKLKTNVGFTFLKTFKSNHTNSGIFNARFSCAYSMGKHTLNSNVMYMYQNITPLRKSDKDLWNMTATLSYQYAISYKKSFLKK